MPVEIKWIECFIGLKVFILEFNDLRGNDRQSLPVIISSITKNLANLENLNCVEIGLSSWFACQSERVQLILQSSIKVLVIHCLDFEDVILDFPEMPIDFSEISETQTEQYKSKIERYRVESRKIDEEIKKELSK